MKTRIFEAQTTGGGGNWGKFLVGEFDDDEWGTPSVVDTMSRRPLLYQIGWARDSGHRLFLDLQTGEGAIFRIGGHAANDLEKHAIWICVLAPAVLEWLYANWQEPYDLDDIPALIDLDVPVALYGRRHGEALRAEYFGSGRQGPPPA